MRYLSRAGSLWLLVLTFVAASPGSAEEPSDLVPDFTAAPRPDDVAVVIGIEKYVAFKDTVEFAESDANLVTDYLINMGYQAENIKKIINEQATGKGIERAIEKWLPAQVKRNSKVFVYYAGHGTPHPDIEKEGEALIFPYDGDTAYVEDSYPLKRLYDSLAKLEAAEVVVVIDACFSGTGGRSVGPQGRALVNVFLPQDKGFVPPPKMAIITAAEAKQISQPSKLKAHGIFTYHFLKAIKDGKQTLGDIYETIKPKVAAEALRMGKPQNPTLAPALDKLEGKFVIASIKRVEPAKEAKDDGKLRDEMKRLQEEQRSKMRELEEKQRELDKAAKIQEEKDRQSEKERQRLTQQAERDRERAEAERQRAVEERKQAEQEGRKVRKKVTITPTF